MRGIEPHDDFAGFQAHRQPHLIARSDDEVLRLLTVQGPCHWHGDAGTATLCLVLHGRIILCQPEGHVGLGAGATFLVPAGGQLPVVEGEAQLLLIERRDTAIDATP